MSLTGDTITDVQIRALRDRYGEGKRGWDPAITHECDLALGDVVMDDIGRIHRLHQARARCAELINAKGSR